MNNIKSGDTVLFNGLTSIVKDVFQLPDNQSFLTIYNQFDGIIDVSSTEITQESQNS